MEHAGAWRRHRRADSQRDAGRGAGGVNIFIRAELLYVQMQFGTYFSYITSKKKKKEILSFAAEEMCLS